MARANYGSESAAQGARSASQTYIPAPSVSYRPKSLVHLFKRLFVKAGVVDKLDTRMAQYDKYIKKHPVNTSSRELVIDKAIALETKMVKTIDKIDPFTRKPVGDLPTSLNNPLRVMDLTQMFLRRMNESE